MEDRFKGIRKNLLKELKKLTNIPPNSDLEGVLLSRMDDIERIVRILKITLDENRDEVKNENKENKKELDLPF